MKNSGSSRKKGDTKSSHNNHFVHFLKDTNPRSQLQVVVAAVLIVAAAVFTVPMVRNSFAASCPAGVWSSSAQFGNKTFTPYIVNNNEWGKVSGSSQTIWANSASNWGVCSFQPNPPTGVKAFGEVQRNVNKPINSFSNIYNSVNHNAPAKGTWEAANDVWINGLPGTSGAIEVMFWNYNHFQTPAGTNTGQTVVIGGQNWTFWKKTGTNPIYTFVLNSNQTNETIHLLTGFNWLSSHGYIKLSNTLSQIDYGFEIVGTNKLTENFTVNSYSLTLN